MTQNTYPDGFPLTPLEAIEFSYTFSEQEKQEWREWVKTATPEQQQELVDTLHELWKENQKEVVPAGFEQKELNNTQAVEAKNQSEVIAQQAPEPKPQEVVNEATPVITEVKKAEVSQPVNTTKEFVFNEEDEQKTAEIVATEEVKQPNRPVENREKPKQQQNNYNQQRTERNNQNQTTKQERQFQQSKPQLETSENKSNQNSNEKSYQNTNSENIKNTNSFFDFEKARQAGSQKMVEQLQKDFLSARTKKLEIEKSYVEQLSLSVKEMEEKQFVLMNKIVEIVLNFENVSDYFETMTTKLLEMNDKIVEIAKEVKSTKSDTEVRVSDMRDDVDGVQRDVDRMYRDMKDMKIETRDKFRELGDQFATKGMDSFGDLGVQQKLSIMQSKIEQLQKTSTQNNRQQPVLPPRQKKEPQDDSKLNDNFNSDSQNKPSIDTEKVEKATQPKQPKKQDSPVMDLREVV